MNIREKINNFAIVHYRKIEKEQMMFADYSLTNKACHFNAVAACRAGRADKVWLAWAGGEDGAVHFINSKNGKYFDETWHDYKLNHVYRIIREVKSSEFEDVYELLKTTKKMFWEMFGTWFEKRKAKKNLHGVI